jgi:hypothetical protein
MEGLVLANIGSQSWDGIINLWDKEQQEDLRDDGYTILGR